MSGHNKWSKIQRKKGLKDNARGASFTKLIKLITVAVKTGGGPDPAANFKLSLAVEKARKFSMPSSNIQNAIKKASGKDDDGVQVESITYEGYGPSGVAIIVDAVTDNRNRTAAEVRHMFAKYGGNLGETGCVGWMFEIKGRFFVPCAPAKQEEMTLSLMEYAIEDIKDHDDGLELFTAAENFYTVKSALEQAKISFNEAEMTKIPKNLTTVNDAGAASTVLHLIEHLEDDEDVEAVFSNIEIPDDIAESLE
ncbi:hypothetical protein AUK40_06640 [Candidatus Wirthbacteria bacterium CG2_30_54_11]|uniref:Probable transcriptional regulatory protein AUK40_06640 n=1 Tax=Candidatus Wirthbacteria bacterium CG2_30_54_11 TaxID=1817892 RepID=A0A1J5IC83_9BACT|nr:MAG: hypothetical protein AUK40_06640 [Candidatus Wirthbacteria bacterium CG2_30_54_11]